MLTFVLVAWTVPWHLWYEYIFVYRKRDIKSICRITFFCTGYQLFNYCSKKEKNNLGIFPILSRRFVNLFMYLFVHIRNIAFIYILVPSVFTFLSVCVSVCVYVCLFTLCTPQFWSHKLVDPYFCCIMYSLLPHKSCLW